MSSKWMDRASAIIDAGFFSRPRAVSANSADRSVDDAAFGTKGTIGTPPRGKPALASEPWTAEDWQIYFTERAAIRQFDGCYPRELADRLAWRETANKWWRECGSRVEAPLCTGCLLPVAGADSIPLATGERVHDADCMVRFGRRWLAEAAAALEGLGIPTPRGYLPDEGAP